ncbi:MAG TPA: GspH/FimT family pseudopilin [Longimicrobium sp.]
MRRRGGFTLVEVVVVLVILAVAAAAVAPALLSPAPRGPARAAAGVGRMLASARRLAVDRGEAVSLTLNPAAGTWRAAAEPAGDSLAAGRIPLPEGVTLAAAPGPARFVFHPLGGATGVPLTLTGEGRTARVEVDRWTGEARVSGG